MAFFTNLFSGLRCLLRKESVDDELEAELDHYLEASRVQKERGGMTPEAARRAALLEVGSRNVVKHQVWALRWESALHSSRG
jgi:hypothetical protein